MIEIIKNEQAGYTRAVDAQSQDRECEARRDCRGVSRIAHQRTVVYYRKPTTAASSGIFRLMVFGIYHMLQIWCGKHHKI